MIPVIQEPEIFLLFSSIAALIFILVNRSRLRQIPASEILIWVLCVIFIGWIFGILKEIIGKELLHFLESVSYTASSILLCIWCWKVFGKERNQ